MKVVKQALKPWQLESRECRKRDDKRRFPVEYAEESRKLLRELVDSKQ